MVGQLDCAFTRAHQGKAALLVSHTKAGFAEGCALAAVASDHFQDHQMLASFAFYLYQFFTITRPEITQMFSLC